MANERTLGFSIEVKGTDTEIGQLQAMKLELSKLEKQFAGYTNKSSVHAVALQTKIKALTQDVNKQQSAIIKNAKEVSHASGSYNALVEENKKLSEQLRALPIDETNQEYARLQKQLADNTEILKGFDGAIGRHHRNVGNYDNSLKDLKKALKDAKSEMLAAAQASGKNSEAFVEASKKAGQLQDELNDVNEATKTFASGSRFEQFENSLGGIGRSLKGLDFQEASEKAQQLGNITSQMTFKGTIAGAKQFAQTLYSVGKAMLSMPIFWLVAGIAAITYALYEWAGQARETTEEQVKGLDKLADRWNRAYEGRIKIQKAFGKETDKLEAEQLQKQRMVIDFQIKLYEKLQHTLLGLTDEQKEKLDELRAKQVENTYDVAAIRIAAAKRDSDMYKKQSEESLKQIEEYQKRAAEREEKAAEDARQRAEERLKDNQELNKKIIEQKIELIEDEQAKDLAREIYRHTEAVKDINATKADAKTKKEALISEELIYQKEIDKIKKQYAEKSLNTNAELAAKELKQEQELNDEFEAEVRNSLTQQLNDLIASGEAQRKQREQNTKDIVAGAFELSKQLSDVLFQNERSQNERRTQEQLSFLEARKETETQSLENQLRTAQITEEEFKLQKQAVDKQFQAEDLAIKKKAFEDEKKLKKQQIGIELAIELARIAANAAANPTNATTFGAAGIAQYAIQAGIAIGRAGIQFAAVDAAQYALGGLLKGKSHAQGGIPFTVGGQSGFEAEGGEAIINKNSTAMFQPLLSAINQAGGGVAFASGGAVPSPVVSSNRGQSLREMFDFSSFADKIVNGINDKKVYQVESDVRGIMSKVSQIESDSSF